MQVKNIWDAFLSRFFILFNLTKPYERPSRKQEKQLKMPNGQIGEVMIEGEILPHKETVMLSEICGYTKTKVKIKRILKGAYLKDEIIEIVEPYYESYYMGEKCLMIHAGYEPLKVGMVYQLILINGEKI